MSEHYQPTFEELVQLVCALAEPGQFEVTPEGAIRSTNCAAGYYVGRACPLCAVFNDLGLLKIDGQGWRMSPDLQLLHHGANISWRTLTGMARFTRAADSAAPTADRRYLVGALRAAGALHK